MLAYGLLAGGHDVTLYSDRTPDQWLNESKPTGSAYIYDEVVDIERKLGMDFWSRDAFQGHGFLYDGIPTPGAAPLSIAGRNEYGRPGSAIDQRLRVSRWLEDLEPRGGRLVIESVTPARLDAIAAASDLTVLAAGKADLASAIAVDPARSFTEPQRNLAMVIVRSRTGHVRDWFADRVPYAPIKFNRIDDTGEYFWVPYHHKTAGATMSLLLEARPGSLMDRFGTARSAGDVLDAAREIVRATMPYEAHIADDMELIEDDPHGWLAGRFTPVVREAFGRLPSGGLVIPVGDTAITFDPIAGQGGNFANRSADFLASVINEHGGEHYDEEFLTRISTDLWTHFGRNSWTFNNHFLGVADDTTRLVMRTAAQNPDAGDTLFNGFVRPDRMLPALKDRRVAEEFARTYPARVAEPVPA
ncbi:FAD-dependent oxidoreductase [Pseudonocardia ailaonensis]|uniref:FAD-dependent oxidoreductase n=1 Tax=Pseudonocardia ailaonensis TaxID=367279 RepID=A0ABN2MR88_9PSEU